MIARQIYKVVLPVSVLISASMALTMGTIMAVVAVLEIHIDRNMVGSMKPSISSRGLVPDGKKDF